MTTLTQAKKLLASVERNDYNKEPFDNAVFLIESVEKGVKGKAVLISINEYIKDCQKLNESALKIAELKSYDQEDKIHEVAEKIKKSRAADMAKSRAKADFLRDVRLTPKANEQLNRLCEHLGLNKTQVINKLLEEQEQLKLL
jgi:hypothetical protein